MLPPREALTEAQRLIDAGQPFSAHEVLEGSWKAAPPAEKALWRALAQLAVGLTHAQRGNPVGAATLLTRGAAGLQALADVPTAAGTSAEVGRTPAGPGPYDIAVEQLVRDATRLADLAATGRSFAPTLRLLC